MDISTLSTVAVLNKGSWRRFTLLAAAAFTALSLASLPAHADTYRWVDDEGVVNYAERKPRNVPDERVTRISGNNAPQPSTTPSRMAEFSDAPSNRSATDTRPQDSELSEAQQKLLSELQQTEANRQAQIAKIRQDNCERARRVLDNLSVRSRIRIRAEDGTERAMSEEERQERIEEAQRGIATNCDA